MRSSGTIAISTLSETVDSLKAVVDLIYSIEYESIESQELLLDFLRNVPKEKGQVEFFTAIEKFVLEGIDRRKDGNVEW